MFTFLHIYLSFCHFFYIYRKILLFKNQIYSAIISLPIFTRMGAFTYDL
nr:MAG TPA: hypothetical protein [Caudoviricetes sp.]